MNLRENSKKILLVGNPNSVFIRELSSRLKKANQNLDVDILSFVPCDYVDFFYDKNVGLKIIKACPQATNLSSFFNKIHFIKNVKRFLAESKYDIVNVHFVQAFLGILAPTLKHAARDKLIVSFWGSDFYRVSGFRRWLQTRLLRFADVVLATNEETLVEMKKAFQCRREQHWDVVRFGLAPLDEIRKNKEFSRTYHRSKLNLPTEGTMVVCGYNGSENQNHLGIIDAIAAERERLPEEIFFVFPVAYGGTAKYRASMDKALAASGLECYVLDDFLDPKGVAHLRLGTDIMIQVQLTDQFSGSMQEHLFAGNMVITGDWLPYKTLEDQGIELVKVASVSEVGKTLLSCLNELDGWRAENLDSIWALSSWNSNIQKWIDIYLS